MHFENFDIWANLLCWVMNWSEKYSVGVKEIDARNKALLASLNRLGEQIVARSILFVAPTEIQLREAFRAFGECASSHLKAEEALVCGKGFDDTAALISGNQKYLALYQSLVDVITNANSLTLAERFYKYQECWWCEHIITLANVLRSLLNNPANCASNNQLRP